MRLLRARRRSTPRWSCSTGAGTLRILWELRADDASLNFRALQAACGDLSASVLNQRLAELREALLVEHDVGSGYRLAPQGRALLVAIGPLLKWAPQWAREVQRSSMPR